jgi:hypothetical protein
VTPPFRFCIVGSFWPVGGIWGGTENIAEERERNFIHCSFTSSLSLGVVLGKVGFYLFYNLLMVFTPLLGMILLEKIMWGGGLSSRFWEEG